MSMQAITQESPGLQARSRNRLQPILASRPLALSLLAMVWGLVRLFPATQCQPMGNWVVWQAHKLLDYGIGARHGAMINTLVDTGLLANPEAFNYTHHPYPYFWFCTLVYSFAGGVGLSLLTGLVHLGACLLVFLALERYFERWIAWVATVIFSTVPVLIHLEAKDPTHEVVMASTLAPVVAVLLGQVGQGAGSWRSLRVWLPGLAVFVAGQIDWFALTLIPALLVLAEGWTPQGPRRDWRARLKNPLVWSILAGTVLTVLVFAVQVVLYEADFRALHSHVALEAGAAHSEFSRSALLGFYFPLRLSLFVGGPLLVGALIGLGTCWRSRSPLVFAALAGLGALGLVVLVMPQFFHRENSLYSFFPFPMAVLTAVALQQRWRWLPGLLLGLCLPGILEAQMYASIPTISETSRAIGQWVARHSEKTDMVLTNLERNHPPYSYNDAPADKATRIAGDRMILFGCQTPAQVAEAPQLLKRTNAPTLFVVAKSCPLAPELRRQLQEQGHLVASETVELPASRPSLAERLRGFVYHQLMHKGKATDGTGASQVSGRETFEVYRLSPL